MRWLQIHLEEFVKPRLGFIPAKVNFFTSSELTVIKNIWRSEKVRSASRPMLLAGRDAFVFEILARREGFPTTFRPDISRATTNYIKEDYRNYYLLDTGFMGSIARGLKIENYGLASANIFMASKYQTFPRLTHARSLALKIESTPKYWETAQYETTSDDVKILQGFSKNDEFARAAGVTIQIYTNSAPRFIAHRQPIGSAQKWQEYEF